MNRDSILDIATKIADTEGIDAVSLTRVAEELGASQPALYRHIENYDGLIKALGLRARVLLKQRLADSAVGLARDDAIKAMAAAWRKLVNDHPGLYSATDRFPCAGDPQAEQAVNAIVDTISRSLAGYDLDEDQRVHAARALRSAFHGFSHLEAGDGHPLDQDLDDSFTDLIQILCDGIGALEAG